MRPNNEQDFWAKVDKTGECWIWLAGKDWDGYGVFSYKNRQIRSTRFVMGVILGQDIEGFEILHSCDNPACVNPKHLSLGTQLDNAADREAKGRGTKGRKQSPGHIAKKAASRRGKKWTQEMKDRMSELKRKQCKELQ